MKKFLITAAVLLGGLGWVRAVSPQFGVPSANTAQPARAEYGGVYVATSVYSAGFTTASVNPCTVYGVTFTSGSASDFVDIYSTGTYSWDGMGNSSVTVRLFNTAISSGGVNPSGSISSAGFVPIGPYPVRFYDGCGFKPSNNDYISILFHYIDYPESR